MKELIKSKLKEIEQQENVKVLLAVESGSRAWGFESKDSDYDVRFIYVRPQESYLKLEGIRDVIEWQLDDILDINGWDIQKALRLLYKSNPTLFEWCTSPIIYTETKEADEIRALLSSYFSQKKCLYHYWHMAKTNYRDYLQRDQVKAKKYFYVLRPILAAKWVMAFDSHPPMEFEKLIESQLEEELKPMVFELLKQKRAVNELDLINKIEPLNAYIEANILLIEEQAQNCVELKGHCWEELNQFFLALLKNANQAASKG